MPDSLGLGLFSAARLAAGLLLTLASTLASTLALAQAPAKSLPELIASCAACHGGDGNASNPQWPSIAGQPRVFIENQLVIIREGLRDVPTMKAVMGTVTDADIAALARHYSALPKLPMATAVRQDQRLRGAEISRRALCGTCHLADYTGQNQVPRLAGQNEPYLLFALKQFRDHSGPGRDTIMSGTLQGMSDRELEDLAHYFAVSRP
jgi:cytochrome c553